MMSASSEDFVHTLAVAKIPTVEQQDKFEVRMLSLVLTGSFLGSLVDPILDIATVHGSMLQKAAALTHAPQLVMVAFALAAIGMLPHLVALLFRPHALANKWPRRIACVAAVAASLVWFYLAAAARPIDAGALAAIYGRSSLGSAVIAFIYAVSLNAQQIRNLASKFLP